jgi:hypothetical protein
MKKIILSAFAAMSLAGFAMAQTTNPDLNDMFAWLQSYYGSKDAAYQALNTVDAKIRAEYPMDQKLADAVTAVRAQGQVAQADLAKKYGFATFDEFYMDLKYHPEKYGSSSTTAPSGPVWDELGLISKQTSDNEQKLTKAYNEELMKRIQAAEIEAVKRIQENAKAMK